MLGLYGVSVPLILVMAPRGFGGFSPPAKAIWGSGCAPLQNKGMTHYDECIHPGNMYMIRIQAQERNCAECFPDSLWIPPFGPAELT